jgi:hypothetical protein
MFSRALPHRRIRPAKAAIPCKRQIPAQAATDRPVQPWTIISTSTGKVV